MAGSRVSLAGETHLGRQVEFSRQAFAEAMLFYNLDDIEQVVSRLEGGEYVEPEIALFFRDFALIQETTNPDRDKGRGIGSLATRIELALGEVTEEDLSSIGYDLEAARLEYDLAFGSAV